MATIKVRVGRAARRAVREAETQVLAAEGRRSVAAKVARAKRVAKKAMKAALVAGAVAATLTVRRERRKRRALEG